MLTEKRTSEKKTRKIRANEGKIVKLLKRRGQIGGGVNIMRRWRKEFQKGDGKRKRQRKSKREITEGKEEHQKCREMKRKVATIEETGRKALETLEMRLRDFGEGQRVIQRLRKSG